MMRPAQLIASRALAVGLKSYFTADAVTRVDKLTLCNATGGAAVVSVYLVPVGSSASTATRVTSAQSIAADETLNDWNVVAHVLNVGDQIFLETDAAVSATCSGVQFL